MIYDTANYIRVWDLKRVMEEGTVEKKSATTSDDHDYKLTLTPNGQKVISPFKDGTLIIRHANTGNRHLTLPGHKDGISSYVITPDSKKAVSVSKDGTLKIWDLDKGIELATLTGHQDVINDVAIIPGSNHIISASDDKTLKVWDLNNGQEIMTLTGHKEPVFSIAVTPDGKHVISTDNEAKIWDLANGKELFTINYCRKGSYKSGANQFIYKSIGITPDGKTVFTNNMRRWPSLEIWRIADGSNVASIDVDNAEDYTKFTTFTMTTDGGHLIAGGTDGIIRIWGKRYGKTFRSIAAHSTPIDVLTLMPDQKRFVTASSDHLLKVWDLASGNLVTTFYGDGAITSSVVSANGTIIAGEDSGRIHFLQLVEGN